MNRIFLALVLAGLMAGFGALAIGSAIGLMWASTELLGNYIYGLGLWTFLVLFGTAYAGMSE